MGKAVLHIRIRSPWSDGLCTLQGVSGVVDWQVYVARPTGVEGILRPAGVPGADVPLTAGCGPNAGLGKLCS
jgi:hypothetical protein